MALPTAYLTSLKNLSKMLTAIQSAQAPDKFTSRFLEDLGFSASADRLMIGILKSLKFIDDAGKPTERYFNYLDQTRSAHVLAEGIRDAYGDLFKINKDADKMDRDDVKNKFKTLSQGKLGDSVLEKMASTFTALVKNADFSQPRETSKPVEKPVSSSVIMEHVEEKPIDLSKPHRISGFVYNIQIHLPETRDSAVYEALFKSLKEHLL